MKNKCIRGSTAGNKITGFVKVDGDDEALRQGMFTFSFSNICKFYFLKLLMNWG